MNPYRLSSLALVLLLAACGGGGGGDEADPGNEQTGLVLDAPLLTNLSGVVADGQPAQPGFAPAAGDSALNRFRGILTFGLIDLPPGARVIRATIRMDQVNVAGAPYGSLGKLVIDHIDTNGFFDNINNILYEELTLTGPIGGQTPLVVSDNANLETKVVRVTEQVVEDVAAGRLDSQFRIRWEIETNSNPLDDVVTFANAVLQIAYELS